MKPTPEPMAGPTSKTFEPMNYDRDYFLAKFAVISEDRWFVGEFTNPADPIQLCAFGHCGCDETNDETDEANALDRLFRNHGLRVPTINDGESPSFPQPTPKQRILAALASFK